MKRNLIYILFFLIFSNNSWSQSVSFTAAANKNAKTNETFVIQFKLEAPSKGSNFNYSEVNNLEVLNVSTSTFQQTSIINGKVSKSHTLTWYLTCKANKTGKYNIPAATVTVNGKKYKSNTLSITVGEGEVTDEYYARSNQSNDVQSSSNNDVEQPNKDIFLNLSTNKTDVYFGEAIYLYTRLYSKYNVNLTDFTAPTIDNFWIQDLTMPNSVKAEYTTLNGTQYLTAILEKKVIFPQKNLEIIIEPYKAAFQLYDGWGFPAGTKRVVSNKKVINVKPLPANKPASFSGAVGDFNISLDSDVDTINVDEAITLTMTVSGLGNFGLFDDPEITVSNTFDPMMPEIEENTKPTSAGIEGSKKYTYTYVARAPGKYTIKPISFAYFNPKTEKYYTKKTNEITIIVKGDSSETPIINGITNKSEVNEIATDIRYIKTDNFNLKQKNKFFFGTIGFWLSYLLPLAAFLFLIIFLRKKIKENANIALLKSKKADKVSKKRIETAKKYLTNNEIDKFYEEITNTLWGYVSEKLSIPLGDLTRETATETFKNHNLDESLITNFISIINDCETARYAPSSDGITPQKIYDRAANILSQFMSK